MAGKRRFGRVRQLPSGRWQVRYLAPDGAERPAPTTFARKTDAERWLVGVENDIERGRWIDPTAQGTTVGEWGERWLAAAKAHLKLTSHKTTSPCSRRRSARPSASRTSPRSSR